MTRPYDDERRVAFEMLVLEGIAHVLHQVHRLQNFEIHGGAEAWLRSAVRYGDDYGNQSAEAPAYRRQRFGVRNG
jgi:hypothetical protein